MDRRRAAAALLALAACISCSAAAPTAGNHTALELHEGPVDGCYYNFQHYGEGDRIMTNEPCLNCTCHNRMLMCYLRVCPFTKAIGQDCTVEKRADQCCPIVTCPDVPVDLLTSTSTLPAEYGATGVGKLDKYGCSIHGKYFPEGSKVPPTPNKPCEHCYCIRNMTTCVMQECTLHVDGCTPIYLKDVCCPVRYSCDHPEDEIPLLDDMTTTVRPTPGFLLTTTTLSPVTQMSQDCVHDDKIFADGALIKTEKACEHCYCMKGDIVCVVQECGTPMENEGKNCTSLPPRHGQCCPDTYICEGDERVTDSTTEFIELTSTPPRRVEGSGYRNEPDEPYTEMSPVTTEIEGSGEDFSTGSQIDLGLYTTPEKEIVDETLYTTESSPKVSGSTEPDKGQNTIPDTIIDKETVQEPIKHEVTLSNLDELMTTVFEVDTTSRYQTSRKDEHTTTESVYRIDDESKLDETLTLKEHDKYTTDTTQLLDKTTVYDELLPQTNPAIIESDQKSTSSPSDEYATKVHETSHQDHLSTEDLQSSVTEKTKFTEALQTTPEAAVPTEPTTSPVTNLVFSESTSVNPNINEVDDSASTVSTPSRIPGEGDCLLNGITYSNNTSVPSTNDCHIGCKCISSIIKCDPIICSPLPEYVENMNDCQPVYDTPNSCCPTYVCNVKETIAPESHSYMSGTESPKPITADKCEGNNCVDSEDKDLPKEPTIQKECESGNCKDQIETGPSIPSQDCSDGNCQILPVVSCEGENCKTEPSKETILEKDSESTLSPAIQEKDEITPRPQDCSDGKCELSPTISCEGENCKVLPTKEPYHEKDQESSSHVPHKICDDENGCDENNIVEPEECVGESCRRKDFAEAEQKIPSACSGTDCKQHDEPTVQTTEQATEMAAELSTSSDIDVQKPESHVTTTAEKLPESDLDVTKEPVHVEYPLEQTTLFEQVVTEPSKKHDIEKDTLVTETPTPILETSTEIPEKIDTETLHMESPNIPIEETTKLHEPSPTEQLATDSDLSFTKQPEYVETEIKESSIKENEISTNKPHIPTKSQELGTVSDEYHTKLPENVITENEKSPTEAPALKLPEEDAAKTEYPETITQSEEFITEASVTEKEMMPSETTKTILTVTEVAHTTLSELMTNEEKITQPETIEIMTEKEVLETKAPEIETEKVQLQTVTEPFRDREDSQTKAPVVFATDKQTVETETQKVTAAEKETPELAVPVKEPSQSEYPETVDTEKQTISPDLAITTIELTEAEVPTITTSPDKLITSKDEVTADITEIVTEKEGITESTPTQAPSVEEHTSISLKPVTSEDESYTKEPVTEPQGIIAEKPEPSDEDKKYDESSKLTPSKAEDMLTEVITETAADHVTESLERDVTTVRINTEEIMVDNTEPISQTTLSEISEEKTTEGTEGLETFTKSPQKIETISDEEIATTDKNLLYTSKPDLLETKLVDTSEPSDQSVTQSQFVTKELEILTAELVEASSAPDATVTDKYKERPETETESTLGASHEITEKPEKHTEAPEKYSTIIQTQDKVTEIPDIHLTLAEEMLIPEKSTEKSHETPYDTDKDENVITDLIHPSTSKYVEESVTTEGSKLITEIPDLHVTKPEKHTTTVQMLDEESTHLTTKVENIDKKPQSSTNILDNDVTESSKIPIEYPGHTEKIEQDFSSTISVQEIVTEKYKETISDILPSKSTYKDEPFTDPQQTGFTKEATESYTETSTKTILESEKDVQDQESTTTKSKTTPSDDITKLETTLSDTKIAEPEITIEKEKDKETPHDIEKDSSKQTPSYTTEESSLSGVHQPEPEDSLTTETSIPNVQDGIKITEGYIHITTKEPETITTTEQSTLDIKERVTTESQLSSSEDKLSTTVLDNKEIQKEEEPGNEGFLVTSSSIQPEDHKKTTELPMSLITSPPQTTLIYIKETEQQSSKTTSGHQQEEEKTETATSELPKQSTETPEYHVMQTEGDKETPSKLPDETTDYLGSDHAEKTTTLPVEDEQSTDSKITEIPHQPTDISKDVTAAEAAPDVYNEIMGSTTTSAIKEATVDTQQQQGTTISLPQTEKEPDHIHEEETPIPVSVDKTITQPPYETQTVFEEDTVTTSVPLDVEHVKETVSTDALPTEKHETPTEIPEIDAHDLHSISPEKDSSDTDVLTGTEPTKILAEKESESSTVSYVPIETEYSESPMPVVTEISQIELTEKDHKPTEIAIQSEEKITVSLDEATEKDILYTQSEPVYTTAQNIAIDEKEIDTESEKITTVPDQIVTQSISTDIPESDVHHDVTESLVKDKTEEHISPSTEQIPEVLTETQTEAIGITKTTLAVETSSNTEETTLKVTEKEAESQPETQSTQLTIEKESYTTESADYSSKDTDKKETDVHFPTELTPTTLESSHTDVEATQTHKEVDISEEQIQTTEPGYEFRDTTPLLVELKEHTHQGIDESSRMPVEEILTTPLYEPELPERGDQNLDVTDKNEFEHQTSVPVKVTEYEPEDKEKPVTQDQILVEENVPTTISTVKDSTERLPGIETVPSSPTYFETDLQEKEKEPTSARPDLIVTTSITPQTVSEKELYTISSDEHLTHPVESSSVSIEKDVHLSTEKPVKSEASVGTTLLDEDLIRETKPTTSKVKEEITTPSPVTDKFTQPEERPIKTTSSPPSQELTKPSFDDEINEGLPSPDFPPSGGGYGQEPDYVEEDQAFGPGTCRYGGKVYVSAQQIPRDDPCDFCFCFRSDIICLQQSCPPPIHGCHEEPIQGFCCPRYECPVSMATTLNVTTTTTTTTTTLPPHFLPHAYKGAAQRRGCQIKGHTYKVGEVVRASSGPCLHCTCGGDGQMKCDPKACTPEPMLRQMIAAAVSAKRRR